MPLDNIARSKIAPIKKIIWELLCLSINQNFKLHTKCAGQETWYLSQVRNVLFVTFRQEYHKSSLRGLRIWPFHSSILLNIAEKRTFELQPIQRPKKAYITTRKMIGTISIQFLAISILALLFLISHELSVAISIPQYNGRNCWIEVYQHFNKCLTDDIDGETVGTRLNMTLYNPDGIQTDLISDLHADNNNTMSWKPEDLPLSLVVQLEVQIGGNLLFNYGDRAWDSGTPRFWGKVNGFATEEAAFCYLPEKWNTYTPTFSQWDEQSMTTLWVSNPLCWLPSLNAFT